MCTSKIEIIVSNKGIRIGLTLENKDNKYSKENETQLDWILILGSIL